MACRLSLRVSIFTCTSSWQQYTVRLYSAPVFSCFTDQQPITILDSKCSLRGYRGAVQWDHMVADHCSVKLFTWGLGIWICIWVWCFMINLDSWHWCMKKACKYIQRSGMIQSSSNPLQGAIKIQLIARIWTHQHAIKSMGSEQLYSCCWLPPNVHHNSEQCTGRPLHWSHWLEETLSGLFLCNPCSRHYSHPMMLCKQSSCLRMNWYLGTVCIL